MSKSSDLKGHSPQAYSREVKQFREILGKCAHIGFIAPGSYFNVGRRKRQIVFKPDKTPNMLLVRFQDGQAAYSWHIVVKEVSTHECAQMIELVMHEWKPDITVTYREFLQKGAEQMSSTNGAHRPPSTAPEDLNSQEEQKHDQTSHPSCSINTATEDNGSDLPESPAQYKWIPEDSRIYKALEAAARQEVKGTYLENTHADFNREIVFTLIKARTPYKNRAITPTIKRLKKGGIWIEFSDTCRLLFVDNVKEFPDDIIPQVTLENNLRTPQTSDLLPPKNTDTLCPSSPLQKQVLATALQAVEDAHAEIQIKIRDYNSTVEWIITSFNGVLTREEIRSLRDKIIG